MVNKVILLGNLGKDPEIRHSQNGKKVASFSVATSERWRDKNSGERVERTEWHNVVVFSDDLVAVAERLRKGAKVYVQGKQQTRKYTDKTGIERWSTETVLSGWGSELLPISEVGGSGAGKPPPDESAYGTTKVKHEEEPGSREPLDDEIPF